MQEHLLEMNMVRKIRQWLMIPSRMDSRQSAHLQSTRTIIMVILQQVSQLARATCSIILSLALATSQYKKRATSKTRFNNLRSEVMSNKEQVLLSQHSVAWRQTPATLTTALFGQTKLPKEATNLGATNWSLIHSLHLSRL